MLDTQKLALALEELKFHSENNLPLKQTPIRVAPIDVKLLRLNLGMTQQQFADAYGFALNTLKNWEQGSRQPEGSARVLLRLIEKDPEYVRVLLLEAA